MTLIPTRDQPPRFAAPIQRQIRPRPSAGINPREMVHIIRKRKWLILLAFVICMSVVAVATGLWSMYAPLYRAEALLRVSPPQTTILRAQQAPMYATEIIERYKRSLAALVKHQKVLEDAVKDRRIMQTSWYTKNKEGIYIALDEAITISVRPETDLIGLVMTGTNKKELPDIVNALATSFVKFTGEDARRESEREIATLKNEQTRLTNRRRTISNDIATERKKGPIAAMRERQSLVSIKLQMLARQTGDAEMLQAQAAAALKAYRDELPGGLAKSPEVLQALEFDRELTALRVRKTEMETALDNAKRKYGDNHRTVLNLTTMIESVVKQVESRQASVIQTQAERVGSERQMGYAIATQQLAELTDRFRLAKEEARDLEDSLGRIETLTQEADEIRESLGRIEQGLQEKVLMVSGLRPGEAGEISPVSIGADATEPRERYAPKWTIMLPLGAVAGLVLGFGLAFLLELSDPYVKNPGDIARRIDLPLLGMIPHSDDLEEEIEDFRRVTLLAPQSPAAEAFRQLRTNLLFSGPAHQRRSLLVTSPAPEDGRTTVVLNLAVCMAQSGRRVLVVDANFRQPAIREVFPEAVEAGLSSALVGQAAWRDVVSPTDVPNLYVIASGPLPPNPTELLGSDSMRQLVSEMSAEYDQVLIDGSPVMVVADARVLSTQVDGTILVVRAGSNNVGTVQKAAEQLARIGTHVVGVVLQGVRTTAGGYLRKNYQTFYEYHRRALP